MARSGKNPISRAIVWVILILLLIGLAGFGARNFGGSVGSIGKVGTVEIDMNRYANALQQELRALQAQTGQNFTLAQAQGLGVDQAVLGQLISMAALENETAKLGLSVGDEEVRRQIVNAAAFRGLDGKFDRTAYEYNLNQSGLTAARFENRIRAETAATIMQSAAASGIATPGAFTNTLAGFIGERRDFAWLELTARDLETPLAEPSDAELQVYYDAHLADFTLPEIKKLTYVWLSPDDLAASIPVDESELHKLYESKSADYNMPERRLVERLVYGSEAEAQAAMAAITAGTSSFEDQVILRGLKLDDIDLGDIAKSDLGKAGDAVFALTEPGVVGPVVTDLGPALIRVNGILAAQNTTFDEARDDLVTEYATEAARRQISDQITNIDDLLAGGATLEDVAKETGTKLGQLDWSAGMSEGIAAYQGFDDEAAKIAMEDFPTVFTLDDGGIYAIRLDEIVAPAPEPLDQAHDKVVAAWERSETLKALQAQAQVIQAGVDNGASLSMQGIPVTVETHATRDTFTEGTPKDFMTQVFKLAPGKTAVISGDDKVIVAQVAAILPPDASSPDTQAMLKQITDATQQSLAQDMVDAYVRALQVQAGISLNQTAINAVHAQFP